MRKAKSRLRDSLCGCLGVWVNTHTPKHPHIHTASLRRKLPVMKLREALRSVGAQRLTGLLLIGMLSIVSTAALGQDAAAPAEPPKPDTGDTSWLLVSTALVMLMTPGLALFYG